MTRPRVISDEVTCHRFEEEALLRLEQGLSLDAHFDTCPACRVARASYQQLYDGLRGPDRAYAGRADWQARVWAAIARHLARRPMRRLWWLAMPAAAAAAAGLFLLLRAAPGPAGPTLALAIHRSGQDTALMRGDHAKPGDTLEVRIRTGGAAHAELRVYRAERELIVRCTDEPPCTRSGDAITATVVLGERGHYQIAFVHGEQPLPAPTQLDDVLTAARAVGATVDLRELDVL